MKRPVRIGLIIVGVLILIALIVPLFVDVNSFRPKLETELTAALGREVRVGNLSLSVFSGSVTADNISIADDPAFSKEPFITAKKFKVGVAILPLIFSKTLHVTGVRLDEPQIRLLRGANGMWNLSSLGGGAAAAPKSGQEEKSSESADKALSVDKVTVDGGRLLVGTAHSTEKPHVYDKVNLEVKDFSPTTQFPFTLTLALPGGGELSLKGKCGPMPAGGAAGTPIEAAVKIRGLDLAKSGFVEASTGIQGVADFDGTVQSNGQQAKTNGTLKVEKWKLAAKGTLSKTPLSVKYGADMHLKSESGTLTQGEIAMGKAVARLTGGFQTQGKSTLLNMKLAAPDMPVDELEAALPAFGVVLPSGAKLQGGTLSGDMAITGPASDPTISGPIRLSNTKLAGFDIASKLAAIPGLSIKGGGKDTTIQNCSTTVRMAPDGTQANAINLTIPALGVVTGAGTISPSGALNFKMNADLNAAAGGAMIQKAGIGGGSGVPFMIQGTTSDPKFVPDVKGMAGSALQQAISGKAGDSQSSNLLNAITGRSGRKK